MLDAAVVSLFNSLEQVFYLPSSCRRAHAGSIRAALARGSAPGVCRLGPGALAFYLVHLKGDKNFAFLNAPLLKKNPVALPRIFVWGAYIFFYFFWGGGSAFFWEAFCGHACARVGRAPFHRARPQKSSLLWTADARKKKARKKKARKKKRKNEPQKVLPFDVERDGRAGAAGAASAASAAVGAGKRLAAHRACLRRPRAEAATPRRRLAHVERVAARERHDVAVAEGLVA